MKASIQPRSPARWLSLVAALGLALALVLAGRPATPAAAQLQPQSVEIRVDPIPAPSNTSVGVVVVLFAPGGAVPPTVRLDANSDTGQSFAVDLPRAPGSIIGAGSAPTYSGQISFPSPGTWTLTVPPYYPNVPGSARALQVFAYTPPPAPPQPQPPVPPAPQGTFSITVDRPNGVYNPGDTITVTYTAPGANLVRVTSNGPNGVNTLRQDNDPGPVVQFTTPAGPPGAYQFAMEAYFYDQLIGSGTVNFSVQGAAPPPVPVQASITVDHPGQPYKFNDPIVVTYSVNPPTQIKVTDTDMWGNVVTVYDPGTPVSTGTFSGLANVPSLHTLVLTAIVNGQTVATAQTTYNVVPSLLSIQVDRQASGATYRQGEPLTVTFAVNPASVVRIIDTNALGGQVVIYDPGTAMGNGTIHGSAGTPGTHTLTIQVLANGNVVASNQTTYTVLPPGL